MAEQNEAVTRPKLHYVREADLADADRAKIVSGNRNRLCAEIER